MAELTKQELNILAYTLLGEAAGEGTKGMEAVMWTIMNRANSGRYSSNPALVATQKNKRGVHQYSTWNKKSLGGNSPDTRFSTTSPQFQEALQVVQRVMAGEVEDPTGGATHFYAGNSKPSWFDSEAKAGEIKIGNHRFAARNTAQDAIRGGQTAADAATLLASGRIQNRPMPQANPVSEEASSYAADGGGLTTRKVQTTTVDSYGRPQIRLNPDNYAPGGTAPARQPVITRIVPTEAVRLSQLRSDPRNAQDLAGIAARTPTGGNNAAANKTSRNSGGDQTGVAARVVSNNAASTQKTARYSPPVKPAVTAQNRTVQQIGQEADNARLSGYRDIQEMGPSSKGAKPTTTVASVSKPVSGLTKTAGTITDKGTVTSLSGSTQMPRDVRPQVSVPVAPKPKPITTYTTPLTKTQVEKATPFNLPASAPRIAPQDELRLKTSEPQLATGVNVSRGRVAGAARRLAAAKKTPAKPLEPGAPTEEELAAIAGGSAPVLGTNLVQPVVQKAIQPPVPLRRPVVPQLTPTQLMLQQMRNSPDYNSAQIEAIERNAGMYSPAPGAYVPTMAPGKKPRRSYGDSSSFGAGGSLVGG